MLKTRYLCKSFRSNTLDIIELAQRQLETPGQRRPRAGPTATIWKLPQGAGTMS